MIEAEGAVTKIVFIFYISPATCGPDARRPQNHMGWGQKIFNRVHTLNDRQGSAKTAA
jgi:hypothetical protein